MCVTREFTRTSRIRLLSLSAALATTVSLPIQAQGLIEMSGIRQFWRVTAELQSDADPPMPAWDSLFATPGYAALEAREHRRAAITTALRAAFMPSRQKVRDSLLMTASWTARVLKHVQPLPAEKSALDSFAEQLARSEVITRASARAATLFPDGARSRYGAPAVAFVFFLPDGRGYPDLLVADLAHLRTRDPEKFFAHEISHFYYARVARERSRPTARVERGTTALLELLTKLHEESIGDQFDKRDLIDLDTAALRSSAPGDSAWLDYLLRYREQYQHAPASVASLDSMLANAAAQPATLAERTTAFASALPLEGRPLGMYLTNAVRRAYGDTALTGVSGDPIGWLLLYADAARQGRCNCPTLSNATVAFLSSLRTAK